MTAERVEPLSGTVDGANRVFTAPSAYVAGSTRVFVRGVLRRQADADGWTETSAAAGTITLAVAPLAGEAVQAYYLDPDTTYVQTVVSGGGSTSSSSVSASATTTSASGAASTSAATGAVTAPAASATAVTVSISGRLSCP